METTSLYSRPDTTADERKWRAAGAPDLCGFQVGCEGVQGRRDYSFPEGFELGEVSLSRAQLLTLPQDPRRLEAELLRLRDEERREPAGRSSVKQYSEQDTLWLMGETILMNTPAPSAVRAAVLP
ncbi:hypothetical protein MF672_007845 [Actinomadura sp. ATCC 31491]|uniref:Uncharacterized protein n=1 Tax=Actinomadura luzonensis TaxID=2805427 RepID=A0ABT0FN22_9ACTN|nr:hypothetical protein [Actinomadura luzonensis]MCK2213697.1 hypothetical protein [Actinomadura luzonensis]